MHAIQHSRRISVMMAALLVSGMVVGFGNTGRIGASSDDANKPLTIAVVPKAVTIDFYQQVRKGAVCAASRLKNVTVNWDGPTTIDIAGQISILQNMITNGVNSNDIAAMDSQALAPVAKQALAHHVAVVTFDSGISPQGPVPLFATNNVANAAKVADLMAAALGPRGGKVAFIHFNPGSQTDNERTLGFKQGLKRHPELKLVSEQNGQADLNTALGVVADILSAHPDIQAIFGAEERAAVGAGRAVQRAGKTGQVKVFGWDAAPDELDALKSGLLSAIIVQNPFRMGFDSVNAAVKTVRTGAKVQGEDTGSIVVTKANLNQRAVQAVINPSCATSAR